MVQNVNVVNSEEIDERTQRMILNLLKGRNTLDQHEEVTSILNQDNSNTTQMNPLAQLSNFDDITKTQPIRSQKTGEPSSSITEQYNDLSVNGFNVEEDPLNDDTDEE